MWRRPQAAPQTCQLIIPMVDQGEKPYSCAYCSLSSSRKDVIVRHTRNFHQEMMPKRAGDGPPTPAHADGDAVQTLSSSSSTPVSQNGGVTQAELMQINHPESGNELCPVFSDAGIQFPDLGLFGNGNTPLAEQSGRQDLVFDIFSPNDPTNSDIWNVLFASAPDISPCNSSNHMSIDNQALPVGPPLSPEQTREQKRGIFGFDDAGYEQAKANLASYDPNWKMLSFRFPSKYAAIRYVKAYYEYLDPQLPMVHRPTFDAATVPCTCPAMKNSSWSLHPP